LGVFVGPGVLVAAGTSVGLGVLVAAGASVGLGVLVAAGASVGLGVLVAAGASVGFGAAVAVLATTGVGVVVALGVLGTAMMIMRQAKNRTSKPPQPIKSLPLTPDFQSWVMRCILPSPFAAPGFCMKSTKVSGRGTHLPDIIAHPL